MSSDSPFELVIAERDVPLLLAVDDDIVIRSMLKKALERQGYEVIEAPNGAEAVALFQKYRPDMVLLDVLMPMMNGFEACEAMRKYDTESIVPILMLTGLDDMSSVDRAFEAGATDFITKPINWSLFTQRVRYALRSRDMDFAIRRNQLRVKHALKVAKLGYWDWEIANNNFQMPANVLGMLGIDAGEINHIDEFIKFIPDDDKDRVIQAYKDAQENGTGFVLEHRVTAADNSEHYVYQHCDVIMTDEGCPRHALGTIQDITELKRAEDMILHQAYHDLLTDLPNQLRFKQNLIHAINVAEHAGNQVAVITLDIDRFQIINSSLGHDSGNEVLITFAGFLSRFIQEGDTVSRISGNEFAILLETLKSIDDVTNLIRDIRTSLSSNAFELSGEELYLSLSIGVAIYPDDDVDAESLMQHANAAMKKAKAQGGDQECFYTTDMNRRVHDRLRMERDLRQALEQNQLQLFYQPQVDVKTRKIIAMEALVRWHHEEHGLIPPIRFIPLAEESGLIQTLGKFVLKEAISQTKKWHDKGFPLRVGINLSARQFMLDDLPVQVEALLNEYQLEAGFVDLEITESIAMQDAEGSIRKMHQLKELGVNLSMDDFGTGYSSLSYLHQFPLDVLKIDRSFVKDIEGKEDEGAIALAVIAMAKSMNLEVIAEGVETEAQYEFLNKHGCHIIQGYLISKPVNAEDFEKLLV